MIDYQLKDIDPEDIEELLVKVETSFNIKFVSNELVYLSTFGQLCDHITNKIQLNNCNDCTSQQAFYKLRNAISSAFQLDKRLISTSFQLTDFLPRQNRRSRTKSLEQHLGFKLNILRPPHWITGILTITLLASFIGLFIKWQIGLSGLLFSLVGFWFANKVGSELKLQTVGQVSKKMTRENYLQSRRNSNTVNKNEVEKILMDFFSKEFGITKSNLTREAKFI